jgi:superfamily II DNA or RNA helicase
MGADKFSQAMWHLPATFRLGLSATPYRKDGRESLFHAHIGQVEVATEERKLIPKVICVDTEWQVPELWQYDPDLKRSAFGPLIIPWGRVMVSVKYLKDDWYRNSIMVEFLQACIKKGRRTVILSDTVEHLNNIKEACIAAGIADEEGTFGYYVGLSNTDVYKITPAPYSGYRKDLRDKAALSKITLATYKMCSEGTNKPWWDTAILATPKADVEQAVGRILREWEGKAHPLVLDLCDYNHKVLATFSGSRRKWYNSIGAEVVDR